MNVHKKASILARLLGVVMMLMFIVWAILLVVCVSIVVSRQKPVETIIVLKEPMTVTAHVPHNHVPFATISAERFDLSAGDKIIVTSRPSKEFVSPRGRAPTHMLGYLIDGTVVDVSRIELSKQK